MDGLPPCRSPIEIYCFSKIEIENRKESVKRGATGEMGWDGMGVVAGPTAEANRSRDIHIKV